ncbi:DUF2889 domain-containing protein [Myxococcota bacterium]|nr:DUF2889 domain-containing protein [Myxococcota bacterium]
MNTSTDRPPLHPQHGIHEPTSSTPARALDSIRRTCTTQILWPKGLQGELELQGLGRDLYTDGRGRARLLSEGGYTARIDYAGERKVLEIKTSPDEPQAQNLLGVRATTGFRAGLETAMPKQRDAQTILYQLLDDVPVAALIAGYARGVGSGGHPPMAPGSLTLQHPNLCAGWRAGGTMLTEIETQGRVPLVTGPDAPSLLREGDPLAWHEFGALVAHGMRRHRRLDLARDADSIRADVLFRDSHMDSGGRETIVHEYTVQARIDPASFSFEEIEAIPRVLPWSECSHAAASAQRLGGSDIQGLRPRVRAEFTGASTCTHLNDTLRSMEDITALVSALEAARMG